MILDGKIHNGIASLCFVTALVAWSIYIARRFGLVFRHSHRRDSRKSLFVMPWEILNEKEWTSEGIRAQRSYLKNSAIAAALLLVLWLVLDSLF